MLTQISGHTRLNKILEKPYLLEGASKHIRDKMREDCLRWFGLVLHRPRDAPVCRCDQ